MMAPVRVAYERLLLAGAGVGGRPVLESGLRLSGLAFFVRFDRVFESVGGGEPEDAAGLNALLRVSFDRAGGIRFWPAEGLECGWEVVSWLVDEDDPSDPLVARPRSVERGVFEGLLDRHRDLFVEDGSLQSTAYRLVPVGAAASGVAPSVGAGGGGRGV